MFGREFGKGMDDLDTALDKYGGWSVGVGMRKKYRNVPAMGGERDVGMLVQFRDFLF